MKCQNTDVCISKRQGIFRFFLLEFDLFFFFGFLFFYFLNSLNIYCCNIISIYKMRMTILYTVIHLPPSPPPPAMATSNRIQHGVHSLFAPPTFRGRQAAAEEDKSPLKALYLRFH